ncbi:hypothetical protein DFH29DRAFT_813982 [Suillus ampliporus]|nr:hypothetical protein DFH29DRAFT_813982 [Suillus ampliporus]
MYDIIFTSTYPNSFSEQSHSSPQSQLSHKYPNETLIYHSYIRCSLIYPTVAISLRTLAAYRQIHRTCPQFSVHIYLEVIHHVNQHLHKVLKHDTPHWRMLNSCPACFYVLDDEPALEFDWLVSIDGNNSLKWWDSTIYGSTRHTDSCKAQLDYWLDTCDVDKFKDERDSDDDNWTDETTTTEGAGTFMCVNRWCNAGPDTCKKMFSIFNESGIFIAVCHHQFIVLACNMVQSEELLGYFSFIFIIAEL